MTLLESGGLRAHKTTARVGMGFSTMHTLREMHLGGREVRPECVYEVQLVPRDCKLLEEAYSDPVEIQACIWGDIVGECSSCGDPGCHINRDNGYTDCCTPCNGVVDFNDIAAVVDKFKNVCGAPAKPRADVAAGTLCETDQIVDFVDIPAVVDAFRGVPYPVSCAPDP